MEIFELTQPGRLAWLALLPVLYLLSRPPRPKRDHSTAYLGLWLQARQRLRRRPLRFRWLRFVLLALAFIALVVAHSEPSLGGRPGPKNLVVLVDTSASMAARGGGGSAWEQAKRRLEQALEEIPIDIDVRVGLYADEVRILRGDRTTILERLDQTEPGGAAGVDLLRLVRQVRDETTAVWTLTDGLGAGGLPEEGSLTVVGARCANLAITACEVLDDWPLPSLRLRVTVQNFGPDRRLRLVVTGGVAGSLSQDLSLTAGAARNLTLPLTRTRGGRLELTLRPAVGDSAFKDGLGLDDKVVVEVPAPPSPTIAVRAEADSSKAVWAAARALAGEFGGEVVEGAADRAAFLITDGGQLADLRPGLRVLSFGTVLGGGTDRSIAPRLQDWDRVDPLTTGLDLSELRIESALAWRDLEALPANSATLLRGDSGVLGVVVDGPDSSSVHLAFRLGESNLFKLAAFPQFVRRAFARSFGAEARPRLVGDPLLDAGESDLSGAAGGVPGVAAQADRPLPVFATPATRLALVLLVLALLFLAVRAYV